MTTSNAPPYPELAAGTLVSDRFELVERIGEGGMGAVWRAKHRVTGGEVAVKTLGVQRDDVRERFIREARIIASLKHRNLIRVHDVLELPDGRPVMIMELLEGETLADRLDREGCLTVSELVRWMAAVVDAVRHAHRHGVVHRDIKPDNIFLAEDEGEIVAKVIDFGIAKVGKAFDHTGNITKTGSVLGTPTYMAPEQVYGERDLDGAADAWSLGMTMYESLTGVCPTESENVGQVFKAVVQRDFRDLSEVRPGHPRALTTLVDRMLSSERDQRPSLDDVYDTITALPVAQEARPAPAQRDDVRAPSVSTAPSPERRRRIIAAAAIAIGLATGALGFRLLVPPTVTRLDASLDGALLSLSPPARPQATRPSGSPTGSPVGAPASAAGANTKPQARAEAPPVAPAPGRPRPRAPEAKSAAAPVASPRAEKRGGVYESNPYE